MADGIRRTPGEKKRDEITLRLLEGMFKNLEKIAAQLVVLNENNSNNASVNKTKEK